MTVCAKLRPKNDRHPFILFSFFPITKAHADFFSGGTSWKSTPAPNCRQRARCTPRFPSARTRRSARVLALHTQGASLSVERTVLQTITFRGETFLKEDCQSSDTSFRCWLEACLIAWRRTGASPHALIRAPIQGLWAGGLVTEFRR